MSTVRVYQWKGHPDAEDHLESCLATDHQFSCTLPLGHHGLHEAWGTDPDSRHPHRAWGYPKENHEAW